MALVWRGPEVTRRLQRAQRAAIDEVAGEAARDLKREMPKRTGRLARSAKAVKTERILTGHSGGVALKFYGRLGRNRRTFKKVERDAQGKLADRIAAKFATDAAIPKADVISEGLYRAPSRK